jgi:hypothetical protein
MGFGHKERIENLFRDLRRNPYAGIDERNKNLLVA